MKPIYLSFMVLILLGSALSDSLAQPSGRYELPEGIHRSDYDPQTIIIKLKEPGGKFSTTAGNIRALAQGVKIQKITQVFSANQRGTKINARAVSSRHGLSRIYKLTLSPGQNVLSAINRLLQNENITYAEPVFKMRPLYIPDDPMADPAEGMQYHLALIEAYKAWDVQKGDTSIVIGILDTGTDLDHEDLRNNLKLNYEDPVDGIDNDGDGYTDNYHGWDFADNDNDPTADVNAHGTFVCGVACAATNNGTGIAGAGYATKFLPIKVFPSTPDGEFKGFEAIVYAAEMGCQVINLSWGAAGAYSRFAQDVIDYAVLEMGVVIVAAAGNDNLERDYYPASYQHVLSVGYTNQLDEKHPDATYSTKIDLVAPGDSYSTTSDDKYKHSSGSSFAAPLVAGTAALLLAQYPEMPALQVMQRIRAATDDIYATGNNAAYNERLGKGRLNMFRALTDGLVKSVRLTDFTYKGETEGKAFYNDTIRITANFVNYLTPLGHGSVRLASRSPYVTIVDSVYQLGSMVTMGKKTNADSPFKLYIHADAPPGSTLKFRLGFEDGNYKDYQYFELPIEKDFLTIDNGTFSLTASNNANLGSPADDYAKGTGFTYHNQVMAKFMGLVIATDSVNVSSSALNNFATLSRDKDFTKLKWIKLFDDPVAGIKARSVYQDTTIGLTITQKVLAWKNYPDNDYFLIEYRITNNSGGTLKNLHAGLFADWDLLDPGKNKTGWDKETRLGYAYDSGSKDLFSGIALITNNTPSYYAFDKLQGFENDSLTKKLKYKFLSSGTSHAAAGNGYNSDIASITGGTIDFLSDKESATLTFLLTAGGSLDDIRSKLKAASIKYEVYLENRPLLAAVMACRGEPAVLSPVKDTSYNFYSSPSLDSLLFSGMAYTTATLYHDTAYFVVPTYDSLNHNAYKIKVDVTAPVAGFSMYPDTLLLQNGKTKPVQFKSLGKGATHWFWNFDNGLESTEASPEAFFEQAGTYTITLITENAAGCRDSVSKALVVEAVAGLNDSFAGNDKVTIYPNPSTGKITLRNCRKPEEVWLTGQLGRKVGKQFSLSIQKNDTAVLDLSGLARGVYTLSLIYDGAVITKRVILEE